MPELFKWKTNCGVIFLCSSLICLQTYYSLLKLGVDIREFFVALALKQSISFREIQYVVCICVQCVVLPRLVVFYDNLLAGKELRQMLSDSREKKPVVCFTCKVAQRAILSVPNFVPSPFSIIIIDKTDAGLNGLCIRDITLICDVINMYNNY